MLRQRALALPEMSRGDRRRNGCACMFVIIEEASALPTGARGTLQSIR